MISLYFILLPFITVLNAGKTYKLRDTEEYRLTASGITGKPFRQHRLSGKKFLLFNDLLSDYIEFHDLEYKVTKIACNNQAKKAAGCGCRATKLLQNY